MSLVKACFWNLDEYGYPVHVMFNPSEYSISRTNNVTEVKSASGDFPSFQYIGKEIEAIDLDLFVDTSDTGTDVRLSAYNIVRLACVSPVTGCPPKLLLVWGTLVFQCIMTSVNQIYKYFDVGGIPLRAELKVTLKGYDFIEKNMEKLPGSVVHGMLTAGYILTSSDNILSAAKTITGAHSNWKTLAKANKIDNPLSLAPGMKLIAPGV